MVFASGVVLDCIDSCSLPSSSLLTDISIASFLWENAISADPDQTAQNASFDQGIHCFLTECARTI